MATQSMLTLSLAVAEIDGADLAQRLGIGTGQPGQSLANVASRVSSFIAAGRTIHPVQLALAVDEITLSSGFGNKDVSVDVTVATHGSIAQDDVTIIGGVPFIWKTSATAATNQVTIGANAAAAATNLITTIGAYAPLSGFMTAVTGGSGIATVTITNPGFYGAFLANYDQSEGVTFSATSFNGVTTLTRSAAMVEFSE